MEDLLARVEKTRAFWTLPPHSLYHHAVSLVTSRKKSLVRGRAIRAKLRRALDIGVEDDFTIEAIDRLADDEMLEAGVWRNEVPIIRAVGNALRDEPDDPIEALRDVSGIGPWTLKALQIIEGKELDVWLEDDYWLRQRLGECLGQDPPSKAECRRLSLVWEGGRTAISNFLWRLRPSGAEKVWEGAELTREDFI